MAAAHQVAVKAAVVAKVMPVVETVDSVAVAKVVAVSYTHLTLPTIYSV